MANETDVIILLIIEYILHYDTATSVHHWLCVYVMWLLYCILECKYFIELPESLVFSYIVVFIRFHFKIAY